MSKHREFINGTCQQLLFSPKGGIEGILVKMKGKILQVSMRPETGAMLAFVTVPGKRVRLLAVPDHSPKTSKASHPVYLFESFADATGHSVELADTDPENTTIKGIVAAFHFARHGQANGVILEGGDFIHLKPQGMVQSGLVIGSKVNAVGKVRKTLLGTRLLESRHVNHIALE